MLQKKFFSVIKLQAQNIESGRLMFHFILDNQRAKCRGTYCLGIFVWFPLTLMFLVNIFSRVQSSPCVQ